MIVQHPGSQPLSGRSAQVEDFLGIEAARDRIASALCRTIIVVAMSIIGMLLPSFEFLQALTGSLTMFTALSMPPYAYWLLAPAGEMSKLHVVWCWFVLIFGLVCTVFSTAQVSASTFSPTYTPTSLLL